MKWIAVMLVLASAALAGAQAQPAKHTPAKPAHTAPATAPRPTLLPSNKQIDESMQRVFGYDPAVTWNILDIRESSIPGLAEVTISVNKQQPYHLFVSTDTQTAVVGQLLHFGPNPFESMREKLKAADGPSLGAKQPVIELVEFSDFQCPHCKAAEPLLKKMLEEYKGRVKLQFMNFPLSSHPEARAAAAAAVATPAPDMVPNSDLENRIGRAVIKVQATRRDAPPRSRRPSAPGRCAARGRSPPTGRGRGARAG